MITLPYVFETTSVWRTILKGAIGLNAILLFGIVMKLLTTNWQAALALVAAEAVVFGFTRVFLRFQTGSLGTLYRDRVDIQPNALFGFRLPGRRNELVWLTMRDSTPDILLARTQEGAGREVAAQLGALLSVPVEEKNAPAVIRL